MQGHQSVHGRRGPRLVGLISLGRDGYNKLFLERHHHDWVPMIYFFVNDERREAANCTLCFIAGAKNHTPSIPIKQVVLGSWPVFTKQVILGTRGMLWTRLPLAAVLAARSLHSALIAPPRTSRVVIASPCTSRAVIKRMLASLLLPQHAPCSLTRITLLLLPQCAA